MTDHAQIAHQFALDVVAGKVDCCRYILQACQRHLDDLDKGDDYPFYFDDAEANRRIAFIEKLPHTKGEWALQRKKLTLEPWQKFGIAAVFGWKEKATGLRRFREAYFEVPRKNGKSALAAGVALSAFIQDREHGAEVYSGATTEKQAWEVFKPARLMVQLTPALKDAAGIQVNASNLNRPKDSAKFEPLIGNPGDGASPSCAIVDEYHEHDSDALYNTMLTGMGARNQPLMFVITTAGANIESPCYAKRIQAIEMLSGTVPDDRLFAYIWTIDEGDDWKDPKVLRKANPNFGISTKESFLLDMQKKAIQQARFTNTFKTKHLNVWTTAKANFFNIAQWEAAADPSLTLEQFAGMPCVLGFDLARKIDMNTMLRVFWRDIDGKRHYYSVAPKFWCPEHTIHHGENQRTAERFQAWENSGHLTPTDGAEVDYRHILADAVEANTRNPVQASPIDPDGATNLSHQLDDEGLKPITIVQNYTNMSAPMKELEAAIAAGRFHHDGNPILTWCISNVIGKTMPGSDDIVRPTKQANDQKIDGAVALIMAIGRLLTPVEEPPKYEMLFF